MQVNVSVKTVDFDLKCDFLLQNKQVIDTSL